MDLASSMSEEGLSCPPPAFLEQRVLQNMHDSLAEHGKKIVMKKYPMTKEDLLELKEKFSLS